MSGAVGLKHCLEEIDNTIKPVPRSLILPLVSSELRDWLTEAVTCHRDMWVQWQRQKQEERA
ncbi:hypothetical protein EYF80_014436 [Liparis tanakae]|uniref:Uncharacterized protein n=1 Tax=Liparis tanakae TaxID=230148 RepID=A0A4Z2IBD3_9TELE|nr:hypothetical protein EYF80_014436 [Liparis tanakae]